LIVLYRNVNSAAYKERLLVAALNRAECRFISRAVSLTVSLLSTSAFSGI